MKQLKIGNVTLPNRYILGPMAGVTDLPFRVLCKEQGAGLLCMEMVSAKAILYNNKNTESLLEIHPDEQPVSLQFFGSDPKIMSEMAKRVEERPFDIMDINMGCPVPKVVRNGEGSALMKNQKLVYEIVSAMVKAIDKPVTVKIRKGFDDSCINAVEIAKIIEEAGAAAVAVHGRTREEITKAVQNMGYMGALVEPIRQVKKKKMRLVYKVTTGKPYKVRTLKYDIRDSKIKEYMRQDSAVTLLSEGMYFDVNVLDAERQRITNKLLQNGYYKFNKEYISYTADTVRNSYLVDLTLHLAPYRQHNEDTPQNHRQYTINKVSFITDYNVLQASTQNSIEVNDSLHYKGFPIYYKDKLYLRPKVLTNNLRITPGTLYNEQNVQRTYSNYGRLQALKYTNIRFFEVQQSDSAKLNAYVMLTRGKHQSVSFEVEGTNSAGDLGAAASVAFQHRNMFKGSETFMFKLRGAYEAVSGLQSSLNQDYIELGAEATINFPRFMFPFVSSDFKRRIRATTEFGLQYNYQMRPEFTRIVASAGWSYKWGVQQQRSQHRIDLLDINYLYMSSIDQTFKEDYLEKDENYILKYNYEDRFIVRTGYSYIYNSAGRALMNNSGIGNSYTTEPYNICK